MFFIWKINRINRWFKKQFAASTSFLFVVFLRVSLLLFFLLCFSSLWFSDASTHAFPLSPIRVINNWCSPWQPITHNIEHWRRIFISVVGSPLNLKDSCKVSKHYPFGWVWSTSKLFQITLWCLRVPSQFLLWWDVAGCFSSSLSLSPIAT